MVRQARLSQGFLREAFFDVSFKTRCEKTQQKVIAKVDERPYYTNPMSVGLHEGAVDGAITHKDVFPLVHFTRPRNHHIAEVSQTRRIFQKAPHLLAGRVGLN